MKTYPFNVIRSIIHYIFLFCLIPSVALAGNYQPTASLNPTIPGSPIIQDGYGIAVKAQGDYVFVSAPFARPAGQSNIVAGVLYVYKKEGSDWNLMQTLTLNGGSDHVGANQIQADGRWLMVSALGTPLGVMPNDAVTDQDFKGGILVYALNQSTGKYELVQTIDSNTPGLEDLTPADPASLNPNDPNFITLEQGAAFGLYFGLDAAKKELLVGAQYQLNKDINNNDLKNSGAVYSFHLNTGTNSWILDQIIKNPDGPSDTDAFGSHVFVKDDVALISNSPIFQFPKFSIYAANSKVYVYNKINGQWVHVQTLHGDQSTLPLAVTFFSTFIPFGDAFGAGLAMDKNKVIIGAPVESRNPNFATFSGAVYAYDIVKDSAGKKTLVRTQKILSDDIYSLFTGMHIAMEGKKIVIGDPGRQGPNGFYQGGLMVMERNNQNQYIQTQTLNSPSGGYTDFFGVGVDINNGHIVGGGAPIVAALAPQLGIFIMPSPNHAPLIPVIPFPSPKVIIFEK